MITVHHLDTSRSLRIVWLLEELGVDYAVQRYARTASGLAPAALRQVHPLGKAPVITDGAFTLAESGAIIDYLLQGEGSQALIPPAGTPPHRDYTYWMHYAEGSLMPYLVMGLVFDRIDRAPWPVRPLARAISGRVRRGYLQPSLENNVRWVEQTLTAGEWFAGDAFTAADIQMSTPLQALAMRKDIDLAMPGIEHFLQRIQARPAYRRALARIEAETPV
ncbi:glutathione S-transferase [Oleiagrimonas soli]|uniref:glutathione transferase n=1 Tax=Oleiagrimonas soli TaxID=1543381 RepID=A0A099CW72_9GAMM|nr:glutathione S-transferase [Oleiagrimonas soli]KGI78218.1 glutathione S-transferase [Oleiagrimonas soli]MBB6183320.1 glutathione S-transferase [Oleiagrimonas soli]